MLEFALYLFMMAFVMLMIGLMIDVNSSPSGGGGIIWVVCGVVVFVYALDILSRSRPG
jgi:hypothetical protein